METTSQPQTTKEENLQAAKSGKFSKDPKTLQELLDSKHPYIKYLDQIIITDTWPLSSHKACKGTGVVGTVTSKPLAALKIRPNDKCTCDSGKKYKKCCGPLVERMRKTGAIVTCTCVGDCRQLEEGNPYLKALQEELKKRYE